MTTDWSKAMVIDWELLAIRVLAANQIGIRIEQLDGHRWIIEDLGASLGLHLFGEPKNTDYLYGEHEAHHKVYGSYKAALDEIDERLVAKGHKKLAEQFDGINYYNDLSNIFGEGVQ